jgi:hypothetical protein
MSEPMPAAWSGDWGEDPGPQWPAGAHRRDAGEIEAVLEGGPVDLPVALRRRRAKPADRKIKVVHRGGYEHFERVEGTGGGAEPRQVVYSWTGRTKMAE